MPSLLPTSLWKQSGRWKNAGDEVLKLNDRKGESFMLAPTHEEVVTDLVAHTVRSYRALPLRLYQIGVASSSLAFPHACSFTYLALYCTRLARLIVYIGVKFRDEARPRSGLIRGREFIMKGAHPNRMHFYFDAH